MKTMLLAAAIALAVAAPAAAQQFQLRPISAPAQRDAIPLYPADKVADAEQWAHVSSRVGQLGIENDMVRNVTRPTITPYLSDPAHATGAAVLVAPGGGFLSLSMTSEGENVARWLAEHGIAAFVLKYRLNPTPRDDKAFMAAVAQRMNALTREGRMPDIREPRATQDALAALTLVRTRAKEFRIDPARVGMIGFSAGAMTALNAALEGKGDARPAFLGYIYGPMAAIAVPTDAPPMFSAIAMDDSLFARQGFGIVEAWHRAGRPVELHAYERGEHGFGMGHPGTTTTGLLPQFREWLQMHGLLAPAR